MLNDMLKKRNLGINLRKQTSVLHCLKLRVPCTISLLGAGYFYTLYRPEHKEISPGARFLLCAQNKYLISNTVLLCILYSSKICLKSVKYVEAGKTTE